MNMRQAVAKVEAKATWGQLVVTEQQSNQLQQIADMAADRRKSSSPRKRPKLKGGMTALFSGPSGTGKTMAAEALANHLKLELYRIDLSQVVGKYIGETEKNIIRVFHAAEESGAILMFDEADALFGKRSKVKDAHDRYANTEVGYLLERMEAYSGLVILATNLKSEIDPAFTRHLRFVVDFPKPTREKRHTVWKTPTLQFNPNDPGDTPYKLLRAVKESGLTLQQICDRLKSDFEVELTPRALSRSVSRGTLRLQRALQILAICGVSEVEIVGSGKK
jgi:SpoVK/Ycf46/Vps4 family AAA+-type ATPase